MSGHSKWSQIKRQKGVADQKRGQLFSKLVNAIIVAAKTGKGLDLVVERAKEFNVPKDKIEQAIARGQGKIAGAQIEEVVYEAYGPEGVAIMIKILTDNKNRSISSLRATLNRLGGRLAESGSVSYLFEEKGVVVIDSKNQAVSQEDLELLIIDSGAEDYEEDAGLLYVYTKPKKLGEVKKNLEFKAVKIESANIEMTPKTYTTIPEDKKQAVMNLLAGLEDDEDVVEVYTNADL